MAYQMYDPEFHRRLRSTSARIVMAAPTSGAARVPIEVQPIIAPSVDHKSRDAARWTAAGDFPSEALALLVGDATEEEKSAAAIGLAAAVGTGTPWFGLETKPGFAVYVGTDTHRAAASYHDWRRQMRDDPHPRLRRAPLLQFAPSPLRTADLRSIDKVTRFAGSFALAPAMIVLDCVEASVADYEDRERAYFLFANAARQLVAQTGAAVVIVHDACSVEAARKSSLMPLARSVIQLARTGSTLHDFGNGRTGDHQPLTDNVEAVGFVSIFGG